MFSQEIAREKAMPRNKIEGICSVENCGKPIKSKGYCRDHYMRQYNYGRLEKINTGDKRNHPLYMLWFDRKQAGLLCWEWALDFKQFVKAISPKPEGDHFLLRIDSTKPYGDENWRWQDHLRRKDGESNKDWWARKRAARILSNPSMEKDRNLERSFGMTREQYNERLKSQNYVCAICEQPETSVDGRNATLKNLAVDHCHKHKGIRELLCWRCNGTLGKINDDVELLQKMIDYLKKHGE